MKRFKITRADKLILTGLKTLGSMTMDLYSEEKSRAKGKGEIAFIGKKNMLVRKDHNT